MFLQATPAPEVDSLQYFLDLGSTGLIAFLALYGFREAWKMIDRISTRFITHLQETEKANGALMQRLVDNQEKLVDGLEDNKELLRSLNKRIESIEHRLDRGNLS